MSVIEKGQCWQFGDDEDHCVWVRGIDVDGELIYMMDNNHNITEWTRDGLLEAAHQVEDD